jgi:1-acyl-sn-glycerol-3-phosphate acyltransferase
MRENAPVMAAAPTPSPFETPENPARWRTLLANLGLYTFLVPGTVILGLLAVLASWIPPRGHGMLLVARIWSRCLLAAAGVRLVVELDPAWASEPSGASYVFMANHASYFDVPALLAVLPGQVRFAAKRTLFFIPVFGWSLWAGGFIPIDRENRARARDAFEIAVRRIRAGASVLFFPEGSRSSDGRLREFERGGFLLALKSGAPLVPVGIDGSHRVMPRSRLTVRPGTIRVCIGAPVDSAGFSVRGRRELASIVRKRIAEAARVEDALASRTDV